MQVKEKEKILNLKRNEANGDKEIKELFYDTYYKAVFGRERDILLKKMKILLNIKERYDNPVMMTGYELSMLRKNGKANRRDIVMKLNDNTCIHIEMNRGKK